MSEWWEFALCGAAGAAIALPVDRWLNRWFDKREKR